MRPAKLATKEANMPTKSVPSVTLFTPVEHAVLGRWFDVEPQPEAAGIDPESAVAELGFLARPAEIDSLFDAAVAHILLESVEQKLPQWAAVAPRGSKESRILFARDYRDPDGKPLRKISLASRSLFTINWADSGPGYSWPVEYRLQWVPFYERWVVTASADSPDAHGYCDFALGSFGRDEAIEKSVGEIIKADWTEQFSKYGQHRWTYLLGVGLISKKTANKWADEVWNAAGDQNEDPNPMQTMVEELNASLRASGHTVVVKEPPTTPHPLVATFHRGKNGSLKPPGPSPKDAPVTK
jgi:hypothetical protein